MSVIRMHTYRVAPADLDEFIHRRSTLIAAIREAHPGLVETRLTHLEDETYTDVWRWNSAEDMAKAGADLPNFPQAGAAMSLTKDRTAVDGEIIDER
jgi:heme-degrading monooxygenase HmoA